jgi:6-pyruvoyltetrahydropterin/6-carboxytetrahydropterin synthase
VYLISVEQDFDAAHFLREYGGKCENIHGHTFRAGVTVKADRLDATGMAYDFTLLKRHLNDILSRFDHTCLNDVPPFDKINPSSENIAVTIYNEIKTKLSDAPVTVDSVEVWESPTSHVVYRPEE